MKWIGQRMLLAGSVLAGSVLALTACTPEPQRILGTLEWQLIRVRAPAAERIEHISVREGDRVEPGQPIAQLDDRAVAAQQRAAHSELLRAQAQLEQLVAGPRTEQIRSARALREKARSVAVNAQRERERVAALVERNLLPLAELDNTVAADRAAQAELAAQAARVDELVAGTRSEELAQAEAAVAAADANLQVLQIRRDRYAVQSPRAGVIESLPFKTGDEAAAGASLATVLVGDAPYARLYLPEARRAHLQVGDPLAVRVHGMPHAYIGRIRTLAHEPSFTPYYALTGNDVDRLVFLAEVDLPADAADLPAGLAVTAELADGVTAANDHD